MRTKCEYVVINLLMHTFVINSPSECTDVGQIRLIENRETVYVSGTVRGQIEICSNQSSNVYSWEMLCDDTWTVEDITVACRDLGYSGKN